MEAPTLMSLKQLINLWTPRCLQCNSRRNVQFGVFCSHKCAEQYALAITVGMFWCAVHECWHRESERGDCEEAKRLSGL